MKELLKTFFETSKERIKNPFIGAFIFSWIAINWKPVLLLIFSTKTIEGKITYIEINYSLVLNTLILPAMIAISYIAVLPYLMWFLDSISLKAIYGRKTNMVQLQLNDIKAKQDLAEEESNLENIKADYREKADLNKKIERLNTLIEDQREQIKELNEEIEVYSSQSSFLSQESAPSSSLKDQKKFESEYEDFVNSDIFAYFRSLGSEVSRRNSVPNSMDDIIIEKYKLNGIITEFDDEENRNTVYSFTNRGHFFWKQYVLGLRLTHDDEKISLNDDDDLPF